MNSKKGKVKKRTKKRKTKKIKTKTKQNKTEQNKTMVIMIITITIPFPKSNTARYEDPY